MTSRYMAHAVKKIDINSDDTEINAARNILARATDPQISRYTPKHEVKRILGGTRRCRV